MAKIGSPVIRWDSWIGDEGKDLVKQGAMHKIRRNSSPLVRPARPLHNRLQAVVLAGVMILLIVGCQDQVTSANNSQSVVDKTDQKPDEISKTLGLLTQMVENCNEMLRKLSGREEAYVSANNAQGKHLMAQATGNVKDIKSNALSLKSDVQATGNANDKENEAISIQIEIASYRYARSAGKVEQALASDSQLAQEKLDAIEKSTNELEENLAEAQRCCDLPPNFLDSNLQELHTQTTSVAILTKRIEFEQPTTEPTTQLTAPPTAQPTTQPTASPTASPSATPAATPSASPTATPTASPTASPTVSPSARATPESTEQR